MKALDEKWFNELKRISKNVTGFSAHTFLNSNKLEKRRFLENEIENPEFFYKDLSSKIKARKEYEELLDEIESDEENILIKNLYLKKIQDRLASLDMLEAIQNRDDKQFHLASKKIYGKPKKEFFAYVALRIKEQCITCNSAKKNAAAKRLRSVFSKIDTTSAIITVDVLPPPIINKDREQVSAEGAKQIFIETLKKYDINDWEVVIDTTHKRKRFSVKAQKKEIFIPSDENLKLRSEILTKLRVEAIAEHEVGVHVLRSQQGYSSNLKLLGLGLHKYLRGEEGLASYMQQQVEGALEFYGFDRYMAASLAMGMDGEVRDFRSVYIIMHDYYTVVTSEGVNFDKRVASAAWDVCVRIFRGTTGGGAGLIYTKDILYLEGNVGVWKSLIDKPHIFEHLFVGKFDPMNETHVSTLQELAILPVW